jgi:4-carboxymuconolactone decarboxylase
MTFVADRNLYDLGARLRGEIQGPERLSQALRDEDDLDEFYHLFGHECCYAQVWVRDGLTRLERSLVTFSMIATLAPQSSTLGVHVRGAVRNGLSRAQLRQILAMITWYAGVPVGCQATETVRKTLKALPEGEGRVQSKSQPASEPGDLARRGRELRRLVLGDQPEEKARSAYQAHENMQESHYFGVLWANEDLTLKHRCLVLLGILCGSNRLEDAPMWFNAALRLGCTAEELQEVALSAAAYCGELIYSRVHAALLEALPEQRS